MTAVNFSIPLKHEGGDLKLSGSLYQASTGATARLHLVELDREDVWWLEEAEQDGEELPINQWRDMVDLPSDSEYPEEVELYALLYASPDALSVEASTSDSTTGGSLATSAALSSSPLARRLAGLGLAALKAEATKLGIAYIPGNRSRKASWVKAIRGHCGEEQAVRIQISVDRSTAWGVDQQTEDQELAFSVRDILKQRLMAR
mmetsp:Transcript_84942/g.164717  ORF Transcript_84942/g.164717 Transcript_84942/m.164717 type:complete len:204 (+) Transcript_84942:228-839(+)|eukprot:CAMPEP_0171685742 /NCGR_PEP_ID=MMETSP0991-20121206/2417_1 /TAXON_ID=483369 /ORGANISM="non described non described, Strain CCMP2098" /LENGTH=203 /DNA_ID=CAMNT_0012273423 /DNA_START=387 /DNA_END=998 /DNA_ORIENTATION=+